MTTHYTAKKIIIITEKIILDKVTEIIDNAGATGYTVTNAGGKGSRGIRSNERNSMTDTYANVKIEVITSEALANDIAGKVAKKYFENYSGITYMEDVEILRPAKFKV